MLLRLGGGASVVLYLLLQFVLAGAVVVILAFLSCWILQEYLLHTPDMHNVKERWDLISFMFNVLTYINGKFLSVIFWPYNLIVSFLPKKKCEPILDRMLLCSATQLAEKIRKKELKCVDVINAYISRIQAVNTLLNAIIEDRFKNALEEAISADRLIESDEMTYAELKKYKPLLGVPLTVKENVATQGMPNNSGSFKMSLIRNRAPEDSVAVKRAREAGAIVIAVTATSELGMNIETYNNVIGTTRNPYDMTRTPGGSSGGEATIISAAGSVVGLGSDVGGSLRIPAHFCGIFSHKASPGTVSVRGHFPSCPDPKWEKYLIIGPMSRYAEDLKLMMEVVMKPEVSDVLKLYKEVEFKDIRMFYMTTNNGNYLTNQPNSSVIAAMENVASYFKSTRGIDIQKTDIKLLKHSVKAGIFPLLALEDVEGLVDGPGESIWKELFKFFTCRSKVCFYALFLEMEMSMLRNTAFLKRKCAESENILAALDEELRTLLKDDGVFLYPTFPEPAFPHKQIITRVVDFSYSSIFNTLGYPVTNCPIGTDRNGLPIGIQIVSTPNNDRLTLAVAREFEIAFGGWHPPPSS